MFEQEGVFINGLKSHVMKQNSYFKFSNLKPKLEQNSFCVCIMHLE